MMSEELKLCPICAGKAVRSETQTDKVACAYEPCPMAAYWWSVDEWQTRPVEDLLRAELETEKAARSALQDTVLEQQKEIKRQRDRIARLHQSISNLCGLEEGTHYRCSGCDEIYEKPPASIVPISEDHTARFCPECSEG
jgi:hypothetical protein